jgi:hypothetical protein
LFLFWQAVTRNFQRTTYFHASGYTLHSNLLQECLSEQ